jgi:hypothetical protein
MMSLDLLRSGRAYAFYTTKPNLVKVIPPLHNKHHLQEQGKQHLQLQTMTCTGVACGIAHV